MNFTTLTLQVKDHLKSNRRSSRMQKMAKTASVNKKKKNLLIINQYYYPDVAATGQLLAELADAYRADYNFTVISGTAAYEGSSSFPRQQVVDGVKVLRVFTPPENKEGPFHKYQKIFGFMVFWFGAASKALTIRHDLVICTTSPPLSGLIGVLLKKIRKSKFIYQVYDLYPEIAAATGQLTSPPLLSLLKKLEKIILYRADSVAVLDTCMQAEIIAKKIDPSKIFVIPPWADKKIIYPLSEAQGKAARLSHGFSARDFLVLYSGNLGLIHQYDDLLMAAQILQNQAPRLRFVFSGGGAKMKALQNEVKTMNLSNISFLPYQKKVDLAALFGMADLFILTMLNSTAGLSYPSKFSSYLAAGKPVIAVLGENNEISEVIRRYNCGAIIESGASKSLADHLLAYMQEPAAHSAAAKQAYKAFTENYEKEIIVKHYRTIYENIY